MRILLSLSLTLFSVISWAQSDTYSRVKFDLQQVSMQELGRLGIETDHGYFIKDRSFSNDLSAAEIAMLKANDIPHRVIIDDVKQWYREQVYTPQIELRDDCTGSTNPFDKYVTPANYTQGTMGGYYTYSEMLDVFTKMNELYPDKIEILQPISDFKTHEGRDILFTRMLGQAETDEEKPQVLYTALHHSREPNSLTQMVFFIWYLLENYDTNPEIQYLVDHTDLYFIPCVNPDGYVYNETTDPQGGGLWRKNRRPNDDGTIGTDLNRNYGFEWGYDDNGSSPNGSSETYRGTHGFSEAETQAVKWLCEQHNFKIALNCHTFSDLLIHPWGYNDNYTDEDDLFKGMAKLMTAENNYTIGTGIETVGYTVNGDSDDWMYGEDSTKNKIYSMTPEVGPESFGFWPPTDAIDQLNKEAILMNIRAASLVHYYLLTEFSTNQVVPSSLEETITVDFTRYGLQNGSATVSFTSDSDNVIIETPPTDVSIELLDTQTIEFTYNYQIPTTNVTQDTFVIYINTAYANGFTHIDSIVKVYDNINYTPAFADNGETLDNFEAETQSWGISSTTFVSDPSSLTDSPTGEYANNSQNSIITKTIDLTGYQNTLLNYWVKWDIEEGYDYAQVIAIDEQGTETALCGRHTTPGNANQVVDEPVYDGTSDWVFETINLNDYNGQKIQLKFNLISDIYVQGDGIYIDDIIIKGEKTVGTIDDNEFISMSIAPNPSHDNITVDFTSLANITSIDIYNNLGVKVLTTYVNAKTGNTSIDISNLPVGIYQARLIGDDHRSVISDKFIKQ